MKISVIVPIYNAEAQIEQALDSIFGQTYPNVEVILINDGSIDRSLEICQSYEMQHENVVLVSIENSGPGAARNVGLAQVTGDYIAFVDADDYLAPNFFEKMLRLAVEKNLDIISSNYYRVDTEIMEAVNPFTTGIVSKNGSAEEKRRYHQFKTSSAFGYVWGKLYKTSFIKAHPIQFEEEKKVFLEDTLFNLKAMAFEPHYYVLNEPLYYYNVCEDSLSNKAEDITERVIRLLEKYESFLEETGTFNQNLDLLVPLTNRIISWSLFKTMEHDNQLNNIQVKIRYFSNNQTVQRIMHHHQVFRELKKIDSGLQIILYSFITLTMRYKLDKLLAMFFFMNYPLFSIYIKKMVRA